MKCIVCNSEILNKIFTKSEICVDYHYNKCNNCGYYRSYKFPKYLDESQYEKYVKQTDQKINNFNTYYLRRHNGHVTRRNRNWFECSK